MIFTKEQVEAMNCFKTEYEQIRNQQSELFGKGENCFIFVRVIDKETGESHRVFYPSTPNQKKVVSSSRYQNYQAQLDKIKEKMESMIPACCQTLKENFHFVVEDIKKYGQSIFEIDQPLFSQVYENVHPRASKLGIDITRSKYIYYLSEFYINHFSDIEIVIDAQMDTESSTLLSLFTRLLDQDEYIKSIVEKQLEKNRETKN